MVETDGISSEDNLKNLLFEVTFGLTSAELVMTLLCAIVMGCFRLLQGFLRNSDVIQVSFCTLMLKLKE